jgi:transcriptional regulator with XRE-family HTH domain
MNAAEIKALRKRLGLTQRGLAIALGVATSCVGNWETGVAAPSVRATVKLNDLLVRTGEKKSFQKLKEPVRTEPSPPPARALLQAVCDLLLEPTRLARTRILLREVHAAGYSLERFLAIIDGGADAITP